MNILSYRNIMLPLVLYIREIRCGIGEFVTVMITFSLLLGEKAVTEWHCNLFCGL